MAFTYKDFALSEEARKQKDEAEKYKQYTAAQSVTDMRKAYDNHLANQVADWTGGTYGESLKEALNRINNREKFTYDLNGDALYQQYKDQYINQGRLAMQDTMGQAAAMTGGYGNSYAATVGNQAYQGYLQKLNDVVPELYNLALNKYNMEGQDLKDQYSLLKDQYNTEYGQYRDKVSDWNTTANRLSNDYYNEANLDWTKHVDNRNYNTNLANTLYDREYAQWSDKTNLDFAIDKQREAAEQAAAQTEATYRAAGYTKDKDGNWIAPAKTTAAPYFLEGYEEDQFINFIDTGDYEGAMKYIDTKRGKGMTDEQAKYWLSFIPEEEEKPKGNTGIMQRFGFFNTKN